MEKSNVSGLGNLRKAVQVSLCSSYIPSFTGRDFEGKLTHRRQIKDGFSVTSIRLTHQTKFFLKAKCYSKLIMIFPNSLCRVKVVTIGLKM